MTHLYKKNISKILKCNLYNFLVYIFNDKLILIRTENKNNKILTQDYLDIKALIRY